GGTLMALSVEEFGKRLNDCGVLSFESIAEFLPPNRSPKDGEELARDLVRQKKLTPFQAQQVYANTGKSLVLGNLLTAVEKCSAGRSRRRSSSHARNATWTARGVHVGRSTKPLVCEATKRLCCAGRSPRDCIPIRCGGSSFTIPKRNVGWCS